MKYLFVVLLTAFSFSVFSQSDCDVKLKAISGEYTGDCKKGLANGVGKAVGTDQYEGEFKKGLPHGKGIYTWANGNKYDGEFKKGEKYGKGILTINTDAEKDSVITGFWKDDEYIGKYEKPYIVINRNKSIIGLNVKYVSSNRQTIEVVIKINGVVQASPIIDFHTNVGKFGIIQRKAQSTIITNVEYPIRATISGLEIEFFKSGYWELTIDKTTN